MVLQAQDSVHPVHPETQQARNLAASPSEAEKAAYSAALASRLVGNQAAYHSVVVESWVVGNLACHDQLDLGLVGSREVMVAYQAEPQTHHQSHQAVVHQNPPAQAALLPPLAARHST